MSLAQKARSVRKGSHNNLVRDNSATSCHCEVFFIKDACFLPEEDALAALEID